MNAHLFRRCSSSRVAGFTAALTGALLFAACSEPGSQASSSGAQAGGSSAGGSSAGAALSGGTSAGGALSGGTSAGGAQVGGTSAGGAQVGGAGGAQAGSAGASGNGGVGGVGNAGAGGDSAGGSSAGGTSGAGGTGGDTGGPPKLPPPELTCVSNPQTLAEVGACAGVYIGTALSGQVTAPENMEIFLREFNTVVLENEMKFDATQAVQGTWSFAAADALLHQATQRPLFVKGHTLIWHSQLASWVPESLPTQGDIDALMQAHIDAVAGYYEGTVYAWEVVNEIVGDDGNPRPTVYSAPTGGTPSYDYVATAFHMAAAAAPSSQLFYNDYNLTPSGAKSEAAFNLVSQLVTDGVPIDGVGIQLHADIGITGAGKYYDPALFRSNVQRYGDIGITVNLSEFDVRVDAGETVDPVLEAQVYYDYVRICVEEPNCDTITFWGISDANSWIPGTFDADPILLYDADYQPRPAYEGTMAALRGDPRPN